MDETSHQFLYNVLHRELKQGEKMAATKYDTTVAIVFPFDWEVCCKCNNEFARWRALETILKNTFFISPQRPFVLFNKTYFHQVAGILIE